MNIQKPNDQPTENTNPEQADINRAQKENGKKDDTNLNEKPGEIADTDPQMDEDDLKPDTGADEAGPEKADVERAQHEKENK